MADDAPLTLIRRDFSGGQNNRIHGANIAENQATVLLNADISVPGETKKRPGNTSVEDLGDDAGVEVFGFEPDGGTNELLVMHGSKIEGYVGSGSFTEHKTDFTSMTKAQIIKIIESDENDVVVIQNGTDNAFRMNQSHSFQDLGDTSTSPPKSTVNLWYRNRWWVLSADKLYWSDAISSDYSGAFNRTTNAYNIPVGGQQAMIGLRDLGIVCIGNDQVWGINPSVTPAATDKPEKILDIGTQAGKTFVQAGDDIIGLFNDGVRGIFRTQQDKLQLGASFPLSYPLKDEFESISWAYIDKAVGIYFDNKYFISLPVDSSTTNNEVWVYYPATQSWMVISGWNVGAWGVVKFSGEERLYGIDSNDATVRRYWTGYDDSGTAINYQLETRKEDLGSPLTTKTGGEYKVRAFSSGDYDLSIYASLDDAAYQLLGTINLAGDAPTLPVSLPFTLADNNIIEESFHLDSLGPWKQIRFKEVHNDTNGSDDIKIFERSLVTYVDAYESE